MKILWVCATKGLCLPKHPAHSTIMSASRPKKRVVFPLSLKSWAENKDDQPKPSRSKGSGSFATSLLKRQVQLGKKKPNSLSWNQLKQNVEQTNSDQYLNVTLLHPSSKWEPDPLIKTQDGSMTRLSSFVYNHLNDPKPIMVHYA